MAVSTEVDDGICQVRRVAEFCLLEDVLEQQVRGRIEVDLPLLVFDAHADHDALRVDAVVVPQIFQRDLELTGVIDRGRRISARAVRLNGLQGLDELCHRVVRRGEGRVLGLCLPELILAGTVLQTHRDQERRPDDHQSEQDQDHRQDRERFSMARNCSHSG